MSETRTTDLCFLTQAEFDALPDYSCTVPSGVIAGKQWKRRRVYTDESQGWLIGRYVAVGNDRCRIAWSTPWITQVMQ